MVVGTGYGGRRTRTRGVATKRFCARRSSIYAALRRTEESTLISQPHSAAEFRLPAPCVDLADDLGGQFGFASHLLLPCFPIAIGLAAQGCRLETGVWPEPINAALDVGFGVDNEEGICLAISHILAPVLKILGQNTKLGGGPSPKESG